MSSLIHGSYTYNNIIEFANIDSRTYIDNTPSSIDVSLAFLSKSLTFHCGCNVLLLLATGSVSVSVSFYWDCLYACNPVIHTWSHIPESPALHVFLAFYPHQSNHYYILDVDFDKLNVFSSEMGKWGDVMGLQSQHSISDQAENFAFLNGTIYFLDDYTQETRR